MNEKDLDVLVEQLLDEPPGPQRDRLLAQVDERQREWVKALVDARDLVWEAAHGAPPLEDDPVAAMLGLVPDPGFQLNPGALAQVCATNGVKPTVLADRLRARGWKVEAADVFRWRTRPALEVSPALIRAIAEEVGANPDRLVSRSASSQSHHQVAEEVASTPRFRDLVARFAKAQRLSLPMAQTALQSRMLATVHRGDAPDTEQMLASLEALVRALEQGQDR